MRNPTAGELAIEQVAAVDPPKGAELLVLTSAARAASWRREVPAATVLADADSLLGMGARFDAAVVDGLLDDEPWDRWLLQRLHRALRMHAPVSVVVRPLTSVDSALDLRFLAYASRRATGRLLRGRWPWFELPGQVRRRYHLPWLIDKMASLGYADIEPGTGWPQNGASGWLASRATVTARKGPSLAGRAGKGWPDAEEHLRRYASQFTAIPASREAWLARFPEMRAMAARPLEPSAWRDARVLVLSPHPDDELIGCGGTLCRVRAAGATVAILQATDGSKLESLRELPRRRRSLARMEEAGRVASALGAELHLWSEEDTRLQCSAGLIARLARLMEELRATHVFTPFLGDRHNDHRALSDILAGALGAARGAKPQVLQYEVWSLAPANLYCDVTQHVERLESLFMLYDHAMRVDDFVHFCESRNLARALQLMGRPAYIEAFLSTSGEEYQSLAARSLDL